MVPPSHHWWNLGHWAITCWIAHHNLWRTLVQGYSGCYAYIKNPIAGVNRQFVGNSRWEFGYSSKELFDSDARKSIPEIKDCIQYLENNEIFSIVGYELVDVLADQVYKGLISSNTQSQVPGRLLKIVDKSIWYDLFSSLDTYEEVEALYDRRIIQLNDTKRYAWVYMKKLQWIKLKNYEN